MADPSPATDPPLPQQSATGGNSAMVSAVESAASRKEKRKLLKKQKRKQLRREAALLENEEEERRANDPEEQIKLQIKEREEFEAAERERRAFEERERLWIEAAEKKKKLLEEAEEERKNILEELERNKIEHLTEREDGDEWEYIEEGPAEIIWQGNEIIVKKKKIKVPKRDAGPKHKEDDDRPYSNPLPPQSTVFASNNTSTMVTAQDVLDSAAQQIPNFGTEQDKTHCPFHLKTGVCRFGTRCSRVHFYPDKSCTLLIKNMYNGPGLAWEQDEGLEYTDEEVERYYEDFYEDVHTEFLKFGELVNFKVCRNGSYHLRGNVYVHYMSVESAVLAYNTMNGRYFGGKQITCEFVSITRWKVAICGEYMKTRLKTCSRGTACNFIHCFRNPGGDYEWADWDNPPPKYWVRKMAALFGPSDEAGYDKNVEREDYEIRSDARKKKHRNDRDSHITSPCVKRRHGSSSTREEKGITRSTNGEHSRKRRKLEYYDNSRRPEEDYIARSHDLKYSPRDSDTDCSKHGVSHNNHKDYEKSSNREHKKHKERHKARDKCSSKTQVQRDEHEKLHQVYVEKSDWHLNHRDGEHYGSNWHSDYIDDDTSDVTEGHLSGSPYGRCSIDSQDRYDGRYHYNDLHSDGDSYRRNKRANENSGSCKRKNYGCDSHYRSKKMSKSSEKHQQKSEARSFRDGMHEFTTNDGPDGRSPHCKSSKVCSPGGIDPTSTETIVEELENAQELSRSKDASHLRRHKGHKRSSRHHGKDYNKAEEGKSNDRQMLKV